LTPENQRDYSACMKEELDALDERIRQLIQLCQGLRKENIKLRQQVATAESANRVLVEKIAAARGRMEGLLDRIPEGTDGR
jgi:cell division protein ZapB